MASRKLLIHSAKLLNFIGEVDNVATFHETNVNHCYCPLLSGASLSRQGRNGDDSTRLYIFDSGATMTGQDGAAAKYMPYSQWAKLEDKAGFWTVSDKGNDYVIVSGIKMRIVKAVHRKNGSRRMWHWEIDCQ